MNCQDIRHPWNQKQKQMYYERGLEMVMRVVVKKETFASVARFFEISCTAVRNHVLKRLRRLANSDKNHQEVRDRIDIDGVYLWDLEDARKHPQIIERWIKSEKLEIERKLKKAPAAKAKED